MKKQQLISILISSVFIVIGLILLTNVSYADSGVEVIGGGDLNGYIQKLYEWSITIGTSLATLVLIYAGYLYATSAGNPEQVNLAKEYIIGALSGLAFLLLAAVIYKAIKIDNIDTHGGVIAPPTVESPSPVT